MKQKLYSLMIALLVGLGAAAQPKADILDVVFNDDGTATDVSDMQNEIIPVGMPYVVKSLKYGINEACFRNNLWGQSPKTFFRVDYEEKIGSQTVQWDFSDMGSDAKGNETLTNQRKQYIIDHWKGHQKGDAEEVFSTDGAHQIISKAYVRYTFDVQA